MPTVSIIMATYNRAHTLPRAIDSVIAQDFAAWELIVVDDASTDRTHEVLSGYADPRIKAFRHSTNRGHLAARNTGFSHMSGVWFTLFDDDDEMLPHALSTLLKVPDLVDPSIDAITCNCIDSVTGEFSGKGLDRDQWLDLGTLVTRCSGEHWGLTKRSLLGDLRFNEALRRHPSTLWYRISRHARRYYIHQALRIYHTDGEDRICAKRRVPDVEKRSVFYRELSRETEYLAILERYRPREYAALLTRIAVALLLQGQTVEARQTVSAGERVWSLPQRMAVKAAFVAGPSALRWLLSVATKVL